MGSIPIGGASSFALTAEDFFVFLYTISGCAAHLGAFIFFVVFLPVPCFYGILKKMT